MINLEKFFTPIFIKSHPVSNLNLKRFAEKHLAALVHNNIGGKYDMIIALSTTAYENLFGNVEDKDLAKTLLKSQTAVNYNALNQFISTVDKHYNLIIYKFPQDTTGYLEFFPHGKTEYNQMNKGNAFILMNRIITACTKYVAQISQPVVDEFVAIRDLYNNTRSEQLQTMETSDLESTEISETRVALEFQLNKNVLILATEYLWDVQRGMDFFDQQYLGRTSSGGGGGTPPAPVEKIIITMSTLQNPADKVTLGFKGEAGKLVNTAFGDGNIKSITMDGINYVLVGNTYISNGNYTIASEVEIATLDGIIAAGIFLTAVLHPDGLDAEEYDYSNNLLTSIYFLPTNTRAKKIDVSGNNLDQQSMDTMMMTANGWGTDNGYIKADGGTNATLSGQGIAAKNQLIARGWTVITN